MLALEKLKQGYSEFLKGENIKAPINLTEEYINDLKAGQTPYAIVVTCSDSRVVPNYIFNADLGDLFVIRTAGNTIGRLELGSIEYAIETVKVPLIVVLGHEGCGAVDVAIDCYKKKHIPKNYQKYIVKAIEPAIKRAEKKSPENLTYESINQNIKLSLKNLFKSSIIKNAVQNKAVQIVGAKYYFNGELKFLEL